MEDGIGQFKEFPEVLGKNGKLMHKTQVIM